jgi:hypothetical protein
LSRIPNGSGPWLEEEYPRIHARARRERALLLFGDEIGVRAGQTAGKSYAPVGGRPAGGRADHRQAVLREHDRCGRHRRDARA